MSRVEKGSLSEGPTRKSFADRFRERNNPKPDFSNLDPLPGDEEAPAPEASGFRKHADNAMALASSLTGKGHPGADVSDLGPLPGDDEAPGPWTRKDSVRNIMSQYKKPKIEYPEDDLPQ
jgi:hypothetical protein